MRRRRAPSFFPSFPAVRQTPKSLVLSPMDIDYSQATEHDARDPLRRFRQEFLMPGRPEAPEVYFVGNSLGLQPLRTRTAIDRVLDQWHQSGVEGHFRGSPAWMEWPEQVSAQMAPIVGARTSEVVIMNTLTVNIHCMLATFYRPKGARNRVLIEDGAFPSDDQAIVSHMAMRGIAAEDALIRLQPDPTTQLLSTASIIEAIETHRDTLSLVFLPGVQYYTGQVLDIAAIADAAHARGILVGFDLAHAAGNIPLALHDWNVDFGCWCTYKYLNSGPGSLGACFIHDRHVTDEDLPRLAGWWGHEAKTRFQMDRDFVPEASAQGWQLSNPPILSLAAIASSLEVFHSAGGMQPLHAKSLLLNEYFRALLATHLPDDVRVLTPSQARTFGCQLSLQLNAPVETARRVFDCLGGQRVHVDWREPNVIRAAPVPLYNSFEDVAKFVDALKRATSEV